MATPYLSIIIPAYNEAERIPRTLIDIDRRLARADYSYEILVIDDGSKDNTVEVVSKFVPMIRNLRIVETKENLGKGGAVRRGMLLAKGQIRLFSDADNSTSIDQFDNMIPFFKAGYAVVIGSRSVRGAKLNPPEPLYRRLIGKALNFFVQVILLWGIHDTQCGFKAFTAEAAENIFKISKIAGWGFDVEILSIAKLLGYKIKEIPVCWVDDARSHVRFSAGLQFIRDSVKIRWWIWKRQYE
ncbi:MAG: glycosyltransferase family 2 protein [Patescibacteria group bacterium]|nr:glycosyltransferase family 2 protein [Patescibacteria group bacterium]